jgi:hypothetical protein
MYQIRLESGEFLDGDFDFQFELNNQVFTTASTDILPGSFTFSVNCPLTQRTRMLLGNPQNVNNARSWREYPNTWVLAYGVPMFLGTIRIQSVSGNTAKLQIISDPLGTLKDMLLTDADYEGTRSTGPQTWANYMKFVAQNPDDYDFTFFQVEYNEGTNSVDRKYQNFFNWVTGVFEPTSGIVTPFPSLYYVLKRVFLNSEWAFKNAFQDEDIELRRLYLYNNADVRFLNTALPPAVVFPIQWDYKKHVPAIKVRDLLKKVSAQFGIGLFSNIFDKTLKWLPLKTIWERDTRIDWTTYAIGPAALTADADDSPALYNYPQLYPLADEAPPIESMQLFNNVAEIQAAAPPEGYFYIESMNSAVVRKNSGLVGYSLGRYHRGVRVKQEGDEYDSGMEALPAGNYNGVAQMVSENMQISTWKEIDGEWVFEQQPAPLALCLYRGWQQRVPSEPELTPLVAPHVWRDNNTAPAERSKITHAGTEIKTSEYSLNWSGEYGLYNKFHYLWAESLRNGKHISQQFALPITALTAFTFDQKVRVQEMDYLIKKLRVGKCLGDNKVQVQAEMVSVI